jgi:hypothetical protein
MFAYPEGTFAYAATSESSMPVDGLLVSRHALASSDAPAALMMTIFFILDILIGVRIQDT